MPTSASPTHSNNQRTVASYEHCARDYAASVSQTPTPAAERALRAFAAALAPDSRVLEIGSGPGWDADFLETLGFHVHRTDVTAAFRDFQAERGKRCDALDVLADPIPASYEGIAMLCVLQHFERNELDGVLRKLAQALQAGGALLLMYPEGDDDVWEHGESGDYRVVHWTREAMDERVANAGLRITWDDHFEGEHAPWRSVLARRPS